MDIIAYEISRVLEVLSSPSPPYSSFHMWLSLACLPHKGISSLETGNMVFLPLSPQPHHSTWHRAGALKVFGWKDEWMSEQGLLGTIHNSRRKLVTHMHILLGPWNIAVIVSVYVVYLPNVQSTYKNWCCLASLGNFGRSDISRPVRLHRSNYLELSCHLSLGLSCFN